MLDDLYPPAHSPLSPFPTVGLSFGAQNGAYVNVAAA